MSDFAYEQDPGGYADSGGDPSFGPAWDEGGQGGGPELDPFDEDSIRAYIEQAIEPHTQFMQQQQEQAAFEQAGEEIKQLVAEHGERLGAELDVAEVHAAANELAAAAAFSELLQAGYPQETALRVIGAGGAFQVLEAVHGQSGAEVARALLAMAAEQAHNSRPVRGDETAVLAKFRGTMAAAQPSRQPHSGAAKLPGWAKDLIAKG